MSTRITIAHGDGFHLYAECLESRWVYLWAEGAEWMESFSSELDRAQRRKEGCVIETPPEMVLRIPREVAERLFNSDLPIVGEGGIPLCDLQEPERLPTTKRRKK